MRTRRSIRFVRRWCAERALAGAVITGLAACMPANPGATPQAAPSAQAESAGPLRDPYHPAPRDTVDPVAYNGWKQYMLQCARCHGDEPLGTSFAPSLVTALQPDGDISTRERFVTLLSDGRPDKGMPSAGKIGLDSVYFEGLYRYLKGRSDGTLHGGRPARREP